MRILVSEIPPVRTQKTPPSLLGQGAEVLTIEPNCCNKSLLKDQVIGCGIVSTRRKEKTSKAGFQGKSEAMGG